MIVLRLKQNNSKKFDGRELAGYHFKVGGTGIPDQIGVAREHNHGPFWILAHGSLQSGHARQSLLAYGH